MFEVTFDDSKAKPEFLKYGTVVIKLKGLAQAKIIKKSLILFCLLNMTI